jgi:hypothetical protein
LGGRVWEAFGIALEMYLRKIRNKKNKREKKRIQIGKEEVKILLFADDMLVYISGPNNSTRGLLNLIKSFSALAG